MICEVRWVTFAGELDNMDKMLIQTELTVIAGDHESYSISAHKRTRYLKNLRGKSVVLLPMTKNQSAETFHQHSISDFVASVT